MARSVLGELLRVSVVMVLAAVVLAVFIARPTSLVLLVGIVVLATGAWLTDRNGRASYDRVLLMRKAVLITGCDTGFGHELAQHLSSVGVQVFAGCLFSHGAGAARLRDRDEKTLRVVQLDVTSDSQVMAAVAEVRAQLANNKFWGVVNNAGLNFLGDVELTTMEQYEKCVQINQLGLIRVTKAFLPLVRANQGRIVNVTSVKGTFSEPLNAAYASTKFAAEAFSDSLRREMRPFGVNVSIVQPCNFGGATDAINLSRMRRDFESMWDDASGDVRLTYGKDYLLHHNEIVEAAIPTACRELSRVTNALTHALFATKPKSRYLVNGGTGWMDIYWIRSTLVHYLPTAWFDCWLARDLVSMPKPIALQ